MNKIYNKKRIIVVVGLLVIALVVGISISKPSNKNSSKNSKNQQQVDRSKINDITKAKEIEGIKISNIVIGGDDTTITVTMDLVNTTDKDIKGFNAYFVPLDIDRKSLGNIDIKVPTIHKNDKASITIDITKYYGETRDFKIVK